jgi:hypothetical protein
LAESPRLKKKAERCFVRELAELIATISGALRKRRETIRRRSERCKRRDTKPRADVELRHRVSFVLKILVSAYP